MMNRWVALACGGSVGVLMLFAAGPLKLGDRGMKEHTGWGPPVLSARALSDDGAETMPGRALSDAPSFRMQSVNRSGFGISAAAPDGKVILVSQTADEIVIFDPANGNFETIDISGQMGIQQLRSHGTKKFRSSAWSADGKLILVPAAADAVGIFDPASKTLELVDIDTSGLEIDDPDVWKFEGGALAPNGNIVFAPAGSASVGVFDPASKDLELVNILGEVSELPYFYQYYMFSDAVATPEGKVIFVPLDLMAVGIFDSVSGNFEAIDIYTQMQAEEWEYRWWKWGKGTLAPNGKAIFAPIWAEGVGIFDPASKTLETVHIRGQIETTDGDGGNMFWGAALAPGGKVVFAPTGSRVVGVFDTSTSTFEAVNISEHLSGKWIYAGYYTFSDACATPDGTVIFAPNEATEVGIFGTTMTSTTSMLKLKLKLKVKGGAKAWLKVKITNGEVKAKAKVSSRRRRG